MIEKIKDRIVNFEFSDKLFYVFSLVLFLSPQLAFFFSKFGFPYIYHEVNVKLIFLFYIITIILISSYDKVTPYYMILLSILAVFLLSSVGFMFDVFPKSGYVSFIGKYLNLTSSFFFSFYLIEYYQRNKNIDIFISFVFYLGILISVINIWYFFLLFFADYSNIFNYTEYIGLGTYINDLGSFFIRPAGYFFDYHSQYYIPMFSLAIALYRKVNLNKFFKILSFAILLTGIFVSGLKTAYLTLVVVFIFFIWSKFNVFKRILSVSTVILMLVIADKLLDNLIFELIVKIFTHDLNIIFEHFFQVPRTLFNDYFNVFLLGGQIDLEGYIYSEVYYVTIVFYLGFFGLFSFFIYPIIVVLTKSNPFQVSLAIIFALSLIHYPVFKNGINIIVTSLFYFNFFKIIFSLEEKKFCFE